MYDSTYCAHVYVENYDDLINLPILPTLPTKITSITFITSYICEYDDDNGGLLLMFIQNNENLHLAGHTKMSFLYIVLNT